MGVRVALEPHFATVVCNAPRALDVLQTVGSKALGLNLDVSHFAVQGLPIGEAVRALGPHAIACEVKDQRGVAPDFQFLIPGEGDFDYAAFLTELAGFGYDGSVAVEISVFRQRVTGYDLTTPRRARMPCLPKLSRRQKSLDQKSDQKG